MNSPFTHLSPFNSPINNELIKPINDCSGTVVTSSHHHDDVQHHKLHWSELSFSNRNCQTESKRLLMLGLPIGFSLATRLLQYFTDQSVVGHLGTDYLAAASIANVLMTIPATFIYAFCGSINVLCSQAYGNKKNLPLVSQWMQLGCVLAALLSIPSFIAFYYCQPLLLLLGCKPSIAFHAGQFAKWSMLSILPNTQFMAIRMYFKAQSNVLPATCVCAVMLVFNLLINLVLVYGFGVNWLLYKIYGTHWNGMGFIGSPIATAITRTVQFLVYVLYMFAWKKYHLVSNTWSPLKLSTFSCDRVKKLVLVAIPQTISSAIEDWQIQIIALFASRLDEADLAAFSSTITIVLICHTLSIGIGDAVSVRVANLLGANKPEYAKYVAYVGIVTALCAGAILGGLLASVGKYLAFVVSGTREIYEIYQEIFPMIGAALFLLSVFTVVVGILVAQARTVGLAITALVGCWGISVPMSYMLGIYWKFGIVGIWIGIILGYTIFATSTFAIFCKSDWQKSAREAVERNAPQSEQDGIEIKQEERNSYYDSLMSDDYSRNNDEQTDQ